MSQPIRGQGGHLVFPIGPKNTNLVDDVAILLPVKFCRVPFNVFRGEVENVSANQRPGRPSCFSDRPEKHKLGRGRWDLFHVKFRWIPFNVFRGEVENVSANQRPGRPSCFSDRPEKHKLGRGRWDLFHVKFRWIHFNVFRGEVENVSANQRPGRPSCFSDRPEKHKLCRRRWDLASCRVSLNSVQLFQRRSRKCLSQSRGQGGHLVFPIGPKNTNFVEDVEILLPVKFRWIPFSGFRGEVEKVSAYQRPGRPSCFSDRPEKHKLGRGRWDLFHVKFRWIPFNVFRGEVENVSANQRPGRQSCFSDRPEKHKLCRGRWDLASCQVSLNSVQRFQRRSRICEKLTMDGRTEDGQRVITIVHLSLLLRCTKKLTENK